MIPRLYGERFVGMVEADGQAVKVSALAIDETQVVVMSLVGSDVSCGVIAATLFKGDMVRFEPADGSTMSALSLTRHAGNMRQFEAKLPNTAEKQLVLLSNHAHLAHLLTLREVPACTYVLAQAGEQPARETIAGHLKAIRIPFLMEWIDRVWEWGVADNAIIPLPGAGISAWRLSTEKAVWERLYQNHIEAVQREV